MNSERTKYYPKIRIISAFDGRVEGRLKLHKSLFEYRNEVTNEVEWPFSAEERGPMDPGGSSLMDSFEKMGLVEFDDDGDVYVYEETEAGSRFSQGILRGLLKLADPEIERRDDAMKKIAEKNKDRSGYEILQDEEIQEAKEGPYQRDV